MDDETRLLIKNANKPVLRLLNVAVLVTCFVFLLKLYLNYKRGYVNTTSLLFMYVFCLCFVCFAFYRYVKLNSGFFKIFNWRLKAEFFSMYTRIVVLIIVLLVFIYPVSNAMLRLEPNVVVKYEGISEDDLGDYVDMKYAKGVLSIVF